MLEENLLTKIHAFNENVDESPTKCKKKNEIKVLQRLLRNLLF
jgi:hypothetical protein